MQFPFLLHFLQHDHSTRQFGSWLELSADSIKDPRAEPEGSKK
jgi:hypothetical protein